MKEGETFAGIARPTFAGGDFACFSTVSTSILLKKRHATCSCFSKGVDLDRWKGGRVGSGRA